MASASKYGSAKFTGRVHTLSFFMVILRLAGFHFFSAGWALPPNDPLPPTDPLPPRPLLPAPLACPLPPKLLPIGMAGLFPLAEPFFCASPPAGFCRPLFCARTACNVQCSLQVTIIFLTCTFSVQLLSTQEHSPDGPKTWHHCGETGMLSGTSAQHE